MSRNEIFTLGNSEPTELSPGVFLRVFASGGLGAEEITICTATIAPQAGLPFHTHPTSEVITALVGAAEVLVDGRRYTLNPYDAIHIPAGVPHAVNNANTTGDIVLHTSFPTNKPDRDFVEDTFSRDDRQATDDSCPETLVRFTASDPATLSAGIQNRLLFTSDSDTTGLCGGYLEIAATHSLPQQTYPRDIVFTAVDGHSSGEVGAECHQLAGMTSLCVPGGVAHRLVNSTDAPAALIWAYAAPALPLLESTAND